MRNHTPTFILELPLAVPAERPLLIALDCARQLKNACLGECLKRLDLLKQSKEYQAICKLPEDTEGKRKIRFNRFKELNKKFNFTGFSLQDYALKVRNNCHIGDHLSSHEAQVVARNVFRSAFNYAIHTGGEPKFAGKGEFHTLENKTNESCIHFNKETGTVTRNGATYKCIIDHEDKVIEHGLSRKVKYCRIVRKTIRSKNRFYVQLVLEGKPYQKYEYGEQSQGLDLGPSTVARVSNTDAELRMFCQELKTKEKELRQLQKKSDRQRRVNNPQNYNLDGTIKKGIKLIWKKSNRQRETQLKIIELWRRIKEYRKTLQGKLSNDFLREGKFISTEKLSYKALQRMFGRSINTRAPGMFLNKLRYKAENGGGYLYEFPTEKTKLSQTCLCGQQVKKPLSQRWHVCKNSDCAIHNKPIQRDLFSAYLAKHVKNDALDIASAYNNWPGAEPLLEHAMSKVIQSANSWRLPASFGLNQRQSGSHAERLNTGVNILDVVAPDSVWGESREEISIIRTSRIYS